jgi:hypothetical protein
MGGGNLWSLDHLFLDQKVRPACQQAPLDLQGQHVRSSQIDLNILPYGLAVQTVVPEVTVNGLFSMETL